MTSDYDGFVRAICENPQDDLVRLVFADWLEEGEESRQCGCCSGTGIGFTSADFWGKKTIDPSRHGEDSPLVAPHPSNLRTCLRCDGRGYLSNGFADMAEFIRLDIEYCNSGTGRTRRDIVESRLEQIGNIVMSDADRFVIPNPFRGLVRPGQNDLTMPGYRYERGFVSEIRLTLADFLDHAKELFSSHPIERVVLTDRTPRTVGRVSIRTTEPVGERTEFFWGDGEFRGWADHFPRCCLLPRELFVRVGTGQPLWKSFETVEAADAALSAAAVAHGRQSAGLPPMPIPVPEGGTMGERAISESNDRSSGHNS